MEKVFSPSSKPLQQLGFERFIQFSTHKIESVFRIVQRFFSIFLWIRWPAFDEHARIYSSLSKFGANFTSEGVIADCPADRPLSVRVLIGANPRFGRRRG